MKKIFILIGAFLLVAGTSFCLFRINSAKDSTEDKIFLELSVEVDENRSYESQSKVIQETVNVLEKRLESYGVETFQITQSDFNKLTICLPHQKSIESVKNTLCTKGKLEFWPTFTCREVMEELVEIDRLYNNELSSLLTLSDYYYNTSARIGFAHQADTAKVNAFLSRPEVKEKLPKELTPMWSAYPLEDNDDCFELIAIRKSSDYATVDNSDIESAKAELSDNWNTVSLTMTKKGSKEWEVLTEENIGRQIAIVLDGQVYSYPNVNYKIVEGKSTITGNFTSELAQELANILEVGKLPTSVHIIREWTENKSQIVAKQ